MNKQFTPIFSVVIPVYNVSSYIEKCIQSVLDQTFNSFEIICVDDGSPDNSVALIEKINDSRIRIIRQKNRGLSGARNTGINASRGIFIALLDADDLWLPSKLSAHYKHFQTGVNIGISYSASDFIDESGKHLGIGQYPKLHHITAKDIFCRNPIGNGSAAVIRKSLLQSVAITKKSQHGMRSEYFDESMKQSEDVEFWLRVALSTKYRFEGIGEALTLYRINMSGLSSNLNKQYESWLYSVDQQSKLNATFVKQWFSLASAYQKRYLARRAVQARNSGTAIKLIAEAIITNPKIMFEEPARTLTTLACAIFCLLPEGVYNKIEKLGIQTQKRLATS